MFHKCLTASLLLICAVQAHAMVNGVQGPNFNFTATSGFLSIPEGNSILFWGFANDGGTVQYPGPTMLVTEGDVVTVTLTNELDMPVSILFPGQTGVVAAEVSAPTTEGLMALEAEPGGVVSYTFTASHPGTYLYQSGTRPELQLEMGLFGALIVYPVSNGDMKLAYDSEDTMYDTEFLFLFSAIDPAVHYLIETGKMAEIDRTESVPTYFFINGRGAPDTMAPPYVKWLPSQPYNCMPMMHPGERLLMRLANSTWLLHPFHFHGNNATSVARDGRLLSSATAAGADLGISNFTIKGVPGRTEDAIFTWTGAKLGWDMYGHEQDRDEPPTGNFPGPEDIDHNGNGVFDSVPLEPGEYEPDHGKPLPVELPVVQDMAFGGMYGGSPFLGTSGTLPPGEGGLNPNGAFGYMWHSHKEKEMLNGDIFPGGMMTMLMINHPDVENTMSMPMEKAKKEKF